MKATFSHTTISGISVVVPPTIINIDDELNTIYKGDIKALNRIKKVIGLQSRHVASLHITSSDLGEHAANILLHSLSIDRKSIDALIFVTQTPDYILPASACYLHGKLGLSTSCFSFDINQACAGYLYGLYISHSLIDSRAANRVLLLCGDTLSKFVNPYDSNLAPIIGDGVSATLLEYTNTESSAFFELGTQGDKFYQLIIPEGAGRIPNKEIIRDKKIWEVSNTRNLKQLYMDGAEIFNFAIKKETQFFKSIFEYSHTNIDNIDYFFFHQANKYIVDNIVRTLNLPKQKVPNNTTSKYGNLSGCSIPATICNTLSNTEQNDTMKVHMAGFGAGLSWGNAILSLNKNLKIQEVKIFKE